MKTRLHQRTIKEISRLFGAVVLAAVFLAAVPLGADAVAVPVPAWTQTTQSDFSSGTLNNTDITSSPGDIRLAKTGTDNVYAFRGTSTKTFWTYDVNAGTWSALRDTLQNVAAGGSMVYDGADAIYALAGNGSTYFSKYSISGNTWTAIKVAPNSVNAGGALAYDGSSYIYALRGGSKNFWRYSISLNTWATETDAPATVGGGGALVYGGGDYVYALGGGGCNYFWRYQISTNSWTAMAVTLSTVGDGGALAWDGGNYLYAFKGDDTVTFWRYSISGNSWSAMADTPATPCVYGGGALTYDNNGHLYALRGMDYPDFWKYNVTGNTWDIKTPALATVAYGGALAYRTARYYSSGNYTSVSFDTTFVSDFQTISWNSSVPTGTTLKFQVAANNDNATWNFTGPDGTAGSYYTVSNTGLWSGLDGNRYIKYKAFFSTTDTTRSAVLNDITITYIKINVPSATTNAASLVEETTATLNGAAASDGGAVCQYAFEWGTESGVYTANTTWTGSVSTGNTFSAAASSLAQGTLYYFRAKLKNSAGVGNDGVLTLLTKPEAPVALTAAAGSGTQVNLSWTKGVGANRTIVLRKTGSYPASNSDGTIVYFGTGTSASDTGLTAGTTYYYRAWSEVTSGSLQQWSDNYVSALCTTIGTAVSTTNAATSVEETTATLNGILTADGGVTCNYAFEWGTASGVYTANTTWTGSLTVGQSFNSNLTGLLNGQVYYYRAKIMNGAGMANGAELSFLTKPEAPTALTAAAGSGSQINIGWTKGVGANRTIVLRKTGSYPASNSDGTIVYFGTGTSASDTGLTAGTTYYYRAWSEVTSGSLQQWSDNYVSTTCTTIGGAAVTTNVATSVEETTATLNGILTADGGAACYYAFEWGTASGVYSANTTWTGSLTTGQSFNLNLTGLLNGQTYYYRAKVKNGAGVANGAELSFLTKPEAPTALTAVITNSTRVDLNWTKGAGANRTKVLRKTGGYPANNSDGTVVYFGTGTSVSDTGLTPETTYFYRAWSEVTDGSLTQWSDNYADATGATVAGVSASTNPPTAVEETTATLNGVLVNDGSEVCQYAFEWGTASGVYTDNVSWAGALTAGQAFSLDLTGLVNGQTYYYRVKIKNSSGTSNGSEMFFLTKPEAPTAFAAGVEGGTQVDLNWTKGTGAVRTKIMRQTGSYPSDYSTGTEVYFGTGTSCSDIGLTPGTTYYYRAWSEVTSGSWQQWSDESRSASIGTEPTPAAVTSDPAQVEETSATFHGSVVYDIGEACQYRFIYGTTPGGPYPYDTGWTGSVTTGQAFSADVTGLSQGTKYYYVAQVKNSYGVNSDTEIHFLTKPEKPENPAVTVDRINATSVTLTWTKGVGAQRTLIRRKTGSYPVDRFDGDQIYYDTGTSFVDTGLSPDTVYYYRLWSQVSGSEQWSDGWQDITVQTSLLTPPPPPTTTPPPTTPPPTTTPVSVGGTVYGVNKMQIMAPWLLGLAAIMAVITGIGVRAVKVKNKK